MKVLVVLAMILATCGLYAQGGDADRGELIYSKKKHKKLGSTKPGNCMQCHGDKGQGMAKKDKKTGEYNLNMMKGPRISGLDEKEVYKQLVAIQKKERKTKNTGTMYQRIKKYSDQDLKDLAAYVSKKLDPSAGSYVSEIWPRKE